MAACEPATLSAPAVVTDRSDGRLAHLDCLNFHRASAWRTIANALPDDDPRRGFMYSAAESHLAASLPDITATYMGVHWLATFALFALEA